DGHWGFHGAETPLDMEPDIITVRMGKQNIHQQMLDWPEYFSTPEAVPKTACTFNVGMFLLADEIIDNVPQGSKEFSVLTTYGVEPVIDAIPSSAIKKHKNARAWLTKKSARALLEFLNGIKDNPAYTLEKSTLNRLRAIWEKSPHLEEKIANIKMIEDVLMELKMI
ncbi:MAG: hypothetical protein B0D92_08520, partial [Spirochaeta sp. LUC14_002_19_P3]